MKKTGGERERKEGSGSKYGRGREGQSRRGISLQMTQRKEEVGERRRSVRHVSPHSAGEASPLGRARLPLQPAGEIEGGEREKGRGRRGGASLPIGPRGRLFASPELRKGEKAFPWLSPPPSHPPLQGVAQQVSSQSATMRERGKGRRLEGV